MTLNEYNHKEFFLLGKIRKYTSRVSISNGIGWNLDNTVMYYVDSLPKKVYAFDYSEQEGTVTNQRVCIDYMQQHRHPVIYDVVEFSVSYIYDLTQCYSQRQM